MNISELELPNWARWIAQDENGIWWAYECEPLQHHSGWYENEVGRCVKLKLASSKPVTNPEWRSTLRKISKSD